MEELVKKKGGDRRLKGKIMAALFFEPSTRTFSSFITAMQRLSGGIIPLSGMQNTSIAKGESFEHTIRVFACYADCLVIRHYQQGIVQLASTYSSVPVINAGDGVGEHPTQALFDVYTILEHFLKLDDLNIALVGDLKFGRTVHSLAKLLSMINPSVKLYLVSPEALKMPLEIKEKIIPQIDVLYVTRVQKERFSNLSDYERWKSFYVINQDVLKKAKKNMILMHPLPIAAGEIDRSLDSDPRALYLRRQLLNGLYLRMALLDLVLRP